MTEAAFFDIDGTLIARNSGPLYMKFLYRRGEVGLGAVVEMLYFYVLYRLGILDIERAVERSSRWIRGKQESDVISQCLQWYREDVRPHVYAEMIDEIERHRRAGRHVCILSSATRYLAEPLAQDLAIEHVIVSRLEVRDGVFTGRVVTPLCYGVGKIHWAREFAVRFGVDLASSYFYTDSVTDLPMLEAVGNPRVVWPDPRLKVIALHKGWQVLYPRHTLGGAGVAQ